MGGSFFFPIEFLQTFREAKLRSVKVSLHSEGPVGLNFLRFIMWEVFGNFW